MDAGQIAVKLGLDSTSFIKSIDEAQKKIKDLEVKTKDSKEVFDEMAKTMSGTETPTKEMTEAFEKAKKTIVDNTLASEEFKKKVAELDAEIAKAVQAKEYEKTLSDMAKQAGLTGEAAEKFKNDLRNSDSELQRLNTNLEKSRADFNRISQAMVTTQNPSKELTDEFERLKKKLTEDQKALNDFKGNLNSLQGKLKQTNPVVATFTNKLASLAKGGIVVTIAKKLYDLGKEAVNTAAKFETLAVSFEVLAGGAEAGQKLTNQIIELASKTPLTTEALSDGARTLLSFGEASEEVVNDLKLLGDITGGDAQRMQSLTLAFAQVGSTGKLAGQDLLQMINAGFNPLAIMSEKTGKSMAQLKDEMSKGLITFNDVKQAMIDATSEGGRFYGMMNKQSETLDGRLSTLSDTWGLVSKNIGEVFLPVAKAAVGALDAIGQAVLRLQEKIKKSAAQNDVKALTQSLVYQQEQLAKAQTAKDKKIWEDRIKETEGYLKYHKGLLDTATKETADSTKGFAALSGGGTGTGAKTGKTAQDKALDEYKKYIQEYNKLNSDYQATLKAKQYIENELGIDPVKEQQDYDQALSLYKNYFSKIQEISLSGARNKAELLKLNEENLARELQEIRVNKELETQRKLNEISQGYTTQANQLAQANESNAGFLGGLFGEGYARRLELEQWYQNERQKIIQTSNNNIELQQEAFENLEILRTQKLTQESLNTWQQYGSDVSSILNQSFSDILSGNMSFSDAMKSLLSNLYQELIKMALKQAMEEIAIAQMKAAALMVLNTLTGGLLGAFSKTGSFISSGFSAITGGAGRSVATPAPLNADLPIYHSGGLVPGTKEQLAVLQGGERVLNRSESASYSSGETSAENGINNIMMFNIKAWDGKDVIQTLKANSQTINQIVNSGIKNNQQGLRSTVQNI